MARTDCSVCGKRAQRACPALDAGICSTCCGSKRGSGIDCAADCGHYPLGTAAIETFRTLDNQFVAKLSVLVTRHVGAAPFQQAVREYARSAASRSEDAGAAFENAVATVTLLKMYHEPTATGKSQYEALKAAGLPGLSNDERVLLNAVQHALPTVIEVQRTLDEHLLQILDLFDPAAKVQKLLDPTLAKGDFPRFTRLLVWLTRYPHFSRCYGGCLSIPDLIASDYVDRVRELAAAAGLEDPRRYLLGHMAECQRLAGDMHRRHFDRLLRNSDLNQCVVVYQIDGDRREVLRILDSKPDFEQVTAEPGTEPGTQVYNWLRKGESRRLEDEAPALLRSDDKAGSIGSIGTVRVASGELTVEAFSKQKIEFAKRVLAEYFGPLLQLRREVARDFGKEMAIAGPKQDGPPPPSRSKGIDPETERQVLEQFLRQQYKRFPDEPVPMLDGLTPREAAKRSGMREKLVALMKLHVQGIDRDFRSRGIQFSLDSLLDELGLPELK